MNEELVKTTKRTLGRVAVGAFIATLGGVLAFSALMAQTPSPSPTARGQCKFWPCTATQPVGECEKLRNDVKKVFTNLMDEASKKDDPTSKTLREKITNSKNGYEGARSEVKARLGSLATFGIEHQVMFYEPENVMSGIPVDPGNMSEYPNNHCLHVFYLPDASASPKTEFNKQLMCCYQPW
jgi:hypothetical protein